MGISHELEELANTVPVELLMAAPERYAPLKPNSHGSWRYVLENGLPTALIWTDWKEAFGVITIREGEVTNRLHNYVVTGKSLDISAGWAYSTIDVFVERFEGSRVTLSEPIEGKLSGAWRSASGAPIEKEEPNEP
jgi:hypothetical protein